MFSIKLLETDRQIIDKILNAIVDELNPRLFDIAKRIPTLIKDEIADKFKSTITYNSLISGELAGEFGFPQGMQQMIVDTFVNAVSDAVYVKYKTLRVTNNLKFNGGLEIGIMYSNLREVLSLSISTISTMDGNIIPWVDWLLLEGDSFIISDYTFSASNRGRSGFGIMVEDVGKAWRVPALYSGTLKNNWVTRTLKLYGDEIANHIGDVIEKEI